MKIQPLGTYRIVSIAPDGRKHEWNLTITPNNKAWKLANTEVSIGDNLNGYLVKQVYEISEPPEITEYQVQKRNIDITDTHSRNRRMKDYQKLEGNSESKHEIANSKIVNSKKSIKDLELFESSRKWNSTWTDVDPWINNISGIYQIKNRFNGNYYIGRSKNVGFRWRSHLNELREEVHHNYLLQEDWWWNLEGNFFDFELLERCDLDMEELVEREQEYIDDHFGNANCYNLYPYASDESWYIDMIKMKRKKKY